MQLDPIRSGFFFFRIVKNRIRNGVHCFEIEWEKPGMYILKGKFITFSHVCLADIMCKTCVYKKKWITYTSVLVLYVTQSKF